MGGGGDRYSSVLADGEGAGIIKRLKIETSRESAGQETRLRGEIKCGEREESSQLRSLINAG